MQNGDVKHNSERITFSKRLKRLVLLEVIKGAKPKDALLKYAPIALEEITKDKKYASKLIYKWKQEAYLNREMMFLLNHDIDNKMIDEEIEALSSDCSNKEIDIEAAMQEVKANYLKLFE